MRRAAKLQDGMNVTSLIKDEICTRAAKQDGEARTLEVSRDLNEFGMPTYSVDVNNASIASWKMSVRLVKGE